MHQLLLRLLKEEDAFELRFQAALRIQCLARLSAARREVERLRNTRRNQQMAQMHHENDAAKTVTRFIRGVADRHRQARVAEERAREEWARRHAAAIKIQKIARGWLARNLAGRRRAYYERIHWAVRVLQCFVRRSLANARVRRMHQQRALVIPRKLGIERRRHAATSIQKLWRGCRERAQTSALRGRMRRQRQLDGEALRRHSSTIIAACWRGHLARRRARVRAAEREKRREADHLGQARRHAAGQIQTAYRAHLGRRAALAVLSEQRELRDRALVTLRRVSATKIQCMVRSSKARVRRRRLALQRRAAHLEGKREHGALSLQRLWRGRQGRRRAEGLRGNARAVKAARLREMDEAAARVQAVQRGHAARQAERERIEQERELLMQRRLRDGAVPQPLPQPGQPMGASAELLEGAYRTTEGEGVSLQMLLDAAEMNGLPIPSLLAVASCGGGPAVSAGPPPDVHADFTDTNGVSWRMSRVGGGPAVLHQFGDFSPRLEVTRVMYDHAAQRMSLTDDATPGSGDTWTLPEHRLADVLCSIACFCATAGVPCQLDAVADFSDIYGGRWRLSRIAGGPPVLHQHGDFSPRLVVTRVLYDIPTRRLSLTEDSTPASSDAIRLHHDGVADAVHSIACWATTAGVPCDLDELTAPAADCACDFTSADGAQFRLSRFGGGPAVLHQYGDFSPRLMVTHVVYDIATHRLSFTTDTTPESADALQLPAETAAESVAAIAAFCATAGICCDTDAFCAAGELWRVAEGPLGVELHCGEAFLAYVEHAAYDCSKRRLVLEGYEVMLDQGSEGAVIARLAEVLARAGVPFARDSFSLADGSMVRIAPAADGTGLRLWGGGKERQKVTKITHNVATGRVALSTGALPNDPTALQLPPAGSSAVLRMLEPVCRAAGVPVLADCFEDAAGALCRMEPSAPGRLMLLRGNDEPARVRCLVHDRATGRFALSRHVSPHGPHGLQLPPDRGGSRGRALEAMRAACEAHGVPHDIGRVQPLLFPTLDGGEVRLAPGAGGGLVMHLDGRPCGAVERAWCDRAALLLTLGPAAEGLRLPAAGLESTLSSIAAICDDAGVPHELRGFRSEDGNTYCFAPNENEAEGGVAVFRNGARAGTAYNVKCDVATRRLQVDLGLGAFAPFMTVVLPPEGAEAVLGHLAALCRGAGVPHYLDTFSDAFHNVWEVRNEGCAVNAYRDGAFDRQVDAVAYDFTTKRLAIGKGADPSAPSAIQLRSEGLGEVLRRVCSVCDEAGVPHRRIDPRPETPRPSRPTERERDGLPEQGAIPTAPAGPLAVVMEVAGEMQLAVPALSTVAQLIAAEGIHPPRSRPATGESKASSAGTHYALPVLLEAAQELGVPCPSLATVADRQQYDARGLAALRVQCAVRRWRACVLVQRMREMADRLLEQQLHGAAATLIQTGMRGCLGRRRFRERRQRLRSAEQRRLREEDRQSDELKRSAQAAPPAPAPAPAPAAPSRAEVVRRRSSAAAAQQPPPEDAAREAARMARRQRELAAAEAQMLRERDERLRSEQRAQLLEQQYQEAMRRRQADDERLEQQLQQRRVDQQGRVRRLQPQEVQQEEWARRGMVSSPQSIAQPKTPPCSPVAAAAEGLMQSFGAPLRLTRAAEKLEQEASRRQLEEEDEAPRPSERPALPGDVPGMQFGVLQDAERIALQRSGKSAEELYRDNAACRIQRMARCRAARDARAHRKQLIEATRGVELSMWRQEVDDRAEAANRIQGISKVRKARVERERRREEQERRNAARADRDLRAAEADAATKIQCQVRGKIARCDAEERRRQREAEIQAQHEGDRRRSQQEEAASTDIQRLHRGRQARKEAEARRAQRGAQQRQREQAAAEEDISPTTAQRLGIDGAREAAAAAIQRGWRCHAARSEHSSRAQLLEAHLAAAHVEEEEQAAAAVRIQSGFRGHTARQEMQRRKEARQQRIDAQLEAERQLAP